MELSITEAGESGEPEASPSDPEIRTAEAQAFAESIVETVRQPLLVLDGDLRVVLANRSFCETFQVSREETQGSLVYELGSGQWDIPELRRLLQTILPENAHFEDFEVRHTFPSLGYRAMLLNACKLFRPGNHTTMLLLAIEDVTERIENAERLQSVATALSASEQRYRTLFETVDEGFCLIELLFDANDNPVDYRFLEANPAFERHTGLLEPTGKTMRELVPDHDEHWFRIFGEIALTGTSLRFEEQAAAMGRWFDVYAQRAGDPVERKVALLFNDITQRKKIEEELRQSAAKNKRIAETLQRSLLLAPPPDAYGGVSVGTIYHSAWDDAQIGGDFFDVFAVDENRVALVVGDATGKGVEAATYTAEVKFALRAFLRVEAGVPSSALERLSEFIARNSGLDPGHSGRQDGGSGSYVALALAIFDTKSGEVICSCAGAEPPLVVRGSREATGERTEEIAAFGPLLGVIGGAPYQEQRVILAPGELLIMTTDGITEARPPRVPGRTKNRPFFGMDGLARSAQAGIAQASLEQSGEGDAAPLSNLAVLGDYIVGQAQAWAGGVQHDDICLLLARRN